MSAMPERPPSSPFPMSEQIARRFHETYERIAPSYGYETRPESAVTWENVPEKNRRLMVATVYALLAEDVIEPGACVFGNAPSSLSEESK